MSEQRLGEVLVRQFTRITGVTLTMVILFVSIAFGFFAEISLRRSVEHSADVVESLLGLYADPEGDPTRVAPEMLAEQLVGMGGSFVITRMVEDEGTMTRRVYFLTPDMPATQLTGLGDKPSPDEIYELLRSNVAEHGGWRYGLLHRPVDSFDIFVAIDRGTYLPFLIAVVAVGMSLLPVSALLARRAARGAVGRALVPLHRVGEQTRSIGAQALDRRVETPTGQAEITDLAADINGLLDRVERAQRSLEKFTADASHELRTPLTYLRAQAQWALDERRSAADMRDALVGIENELHRTSKLAEDMLLIARMENRQLVVQQEPFELTPVLRDIEEIAIAMGHEKQIEVHADTDREIRAIGDPDRTRQILLNLVGNAARYTEGGEIHLSTLLNGSMVGIEVSDTGPGIPPEVVEHIFDRFYRAEESRSRAHGGSGLGLTIARLLAELQGGSLSVESNPGEGSKFTLWLPTL